MMATNLHDNNAIHDENGFSPACSYCMSISTFENSTKDLAKLCPSCKAKREPKCDDCGGSLNPQAPTLNSIRGRCVTDLKNGDIVYKPNGEAFRLEPDSYYNRLPVEMLGKMIPEAQ